MLFDFDGEKISESRLGILANSDDSSIRKPFLADPKFLKYKGFAVADEADNGIGLWYLPFDKKADTPRFKECAKHPQ